MAAETLITPNFQAKDWEVIVGILENSSYPDLRRMKFDLINYYAANANPTGTTVIPIQIKEKTLIKIHQEFYRQPSRNLHNDQGASPLKRVIDIIKLKAAATAAAVPADNYLTTQIAQEDAARDAQQTSIRKSGRNTLMMEAYDNS